MLRLTNLANKYQRRTLRALYAQTQAYPYDAQLVSTHNRSAANFTVGATSASIVPGAVAAKLAGEVVGLAGVDASLGDQVTDNYSPFGLFANFVGGQLSDIPDDFDRVGVWRGAGGVFEILAPAFTDTGLSALATAEAGTGATEVYFKADTDGKLVGAAGVYALGDGRPVARLMKRLSAHAVIVELLV